MTAGLPCSGAIIRSLQLAALKKRAVKCLLQSKRREGQETRKGQSSRETAWQEAHTKGHIKNSTARIKHIHGGGDTADTGQESGLSISERFFTHSSL